MSRKRQDSRGPGEHPGPLHMIVDVSLLSLLMKARLLPAASPDRPEAIGHERPN